MATLFADFPVSGSGPSGPLGSALLHLLVVGILLMVTRTKLRDRAATPLSQYRVRVLQLHKLESRKMKASAYGMTNKAPKSISAESVSGKESPESMFSRPLESRETAKQTLVQPDATAPVIVKERLPVPAVLLWKTERTPVKIISPSSPIVVMAGPARPSLDAPNHADTQADIRISATAFDSTAEVPPSTTAPVATPALVAANKVPETPSTLQAPPASAVVLSVSDQRQDESKILLPLQNQVLSSTAGDLLTPGNQKAGTGIMDTNDAGYGKSISATKGSGGSAEMSSGPAGMTAGDGEPDKKAPQAGEFGDGADMIRLNVPKDGKFGMVVVGSSLAEQFPEARGLWNSRLAYTVYLHVGSNKNWILQYSLPPEADSLGGGNVARPEAPWPYVMVRPKASPRELATNAIIIHGYVNVTGLFAKISVVFPQEYADGEMLLAALREWRFRPARQNGRQTVVEVLLIIPGEDH